LIENSQISFNENVAITKISPSKHLNNKPTSSEELLKTLPVLEYEVIKYLNNWRRHVPRILVISR
jgi:hypothetical protein